MKKLFAVFVLALLLFACGEFNLAEVEVEIPAGKNFASYSSPIQSAAKFNSFFVKFHTVGEGEIAFIAWFEVADGSGQLEKNEIEIECENSECSGFAISSLARAYEFQIELSGESGFRASNFEIETKNISVKNSLTYELARGLIPIARAQLTDLSIISREDWGANPDYLLERNIATIPSNGEAWSKRYQDCEEWQRNHPTEFKNDGRLISVDVKNRELQWPRTYSKEIRKVVIHSTATDGEKDVNGDDEFTPEDVEATVRAIYYYHAMWRAWGDIGYHFLIDSFGNIYEGRSGGDFVIGAHAFCGNTGTIGVSFIGNFREELPSNAALDSAEQLLGELANLYSLDLSASSTWHGKHTKNLIGHREVVATECPGDELQAHLAEIATRAMNYARGNKTSNADFDYRLSESNSPLFLDSFETGLFEFRLKNSGKKAWPADSKLRISRSEIFKNREGASIASENEFVAQLDRQVSAGSFVRIKIPVEARAQPGRYRFGIIPSFDGQDVRKFFAVVNVAEPHLDYEFLRAEHPPQPFAPNSTAEASIEIKNKSDFTWKSSGSNRMILETLDEEISLFTNSVEVGHLETDTPPGETAKFTLPLDAPERAGRYWLEFRPAVAGSFALPDYGMKFHISVREPRFSGELLAKSSNLDSRLAPGETKNLFLEFQNTSQLDWNPEQFSLEILRNDGVGFAAENLKLPAEVKKDARVRIEFPATAPLRAGRYQLTLRPKLTTNGKIKTLPPVNFIIEVEPPRLTGKLIEQLETIELQENETATVSFAYENTGNVVWNSCDTLLQKLPAVFSSFADESWLSPLQPAKLKEESVVPGEVGTFEFTVRKNSALSDETEIFIPIVRGLGRIRGRAIKLTVSSSTGLTTGGLQFTSDSQQLAESQEFEIQSEAAAKSKNSADLLAASEEEIGNAKPTIRIKLSFESNRVEIGGGEFAIEQFGQSLFRGNFAAFEVSKMNDGEYFRVLPEGETILEIPNWEKLNWNGSMNHNKFRGILEIRRVGENLAVINELPLETYLHGIAEPAPSDPIEKKKLMAILARSYALYYIDPNHRKFPGKAWNGSDSPAEFQQYLGFNYEIHGGFREFVEATEGLVVKFENAVVKTPYFTSSDGITKTAAEAGWDSEDFKFVKKVEDPWSCGLNSNALGTEFSCPGNARGHGVGVSGKGAAGLAREGKTYEEILDYFFEEVEVEKIY
ncbi:N-acetylmuramoyl-L-alanine amidase [Candidatus Gracilibacteria bacterium]|nr:N-acetylmuramoyl-L-alanine amidase [Candidatus Gracilibacteria bacterium]